MPISASSSSRICAALACAVLLTACSPEFNWREVRGAGAPYTVTLPAKPASHARPVNLDGLQVTMTMTAAEAGDITFAVGAAEVADATQAGKALQAMKAALVRNIDGALKREKSSAPPQMIEIEAAGQSRLLLARFVAKDKYVYQVVALGPEKTLSQPAAREAADTFLTSFRPD
jgi:pectin methylesterase-like acyl-CoA thioesterase